MDLSGGSSGGGSINIFTNQSTGINQLGIVTNTKYAEMLGTTNASGGSSVGTRGHGGAGGTGTVNIGEIKNGQYYDLKEIINQDIEALKVHIYSSYTYPVFNGTSLTDGYYTVKITMPEGYEKIVYTLDNGATWLDYTEEFTLTEAKTIKAKAIKNDDTESQTETLAMTEVNDNLTSITSTISANTSKTFVFEDNLSVDILRVYLESDPSDTAVIKFYDNKNNELSSNSMSKITSLHVPSKTTKVTISSGTSELVITDINLTTRESIQSDLPEISISSTNWTQEKEITISYPDGGINEYSLDNGETWNEYSSSITVNNIATVIARTRTNDGTVLTASSFTITKIDNTEPTIKLDIPEEIKVGASYSLPTSYTVDNTKSGGSAICKINDNEINSTSTLEKGEYEIVCTVTTGAGKEATVSKTVKVLEEYTITFDYQVNGIDNVTSKVLEGNKLGSLPTMTRDNYSLVGWYTDNTNYDTSVDENTVPSGNDTYYAKWEEMEKEKNIIIMVN